MEKQDAMRGTKSAQVMEGPVVDGAGPGIYRPVHLIARGAARRCSHGSCGCDGTCGDACRCRPKREP